MGRNRLMASDDLMGEEIALPPTPERVSRADRNGAYGRASPLEIVLAAFGVTAWMWCAFEVLSAVIPT
jgi:hypothetical protein